MIHSTPRPEFCTPALCAVLEEGVREIVGPERTAQLFEQARQAAQPGFPAAGGLSHAEIGALQQTLESWYGPLSGRGLAVRIGRAGFRRAVRRWGGESGINRLEFRLLPTPRRMRAGLDTAAGWLRAEAGLAVQVDENETAWFWNVSGCCTPDLIVGMLQELTTWAGAGRTYRVVHQPPDGFNIPKKALD